MSESTDKSGLGDEKGKKTKRNPSPEHEEKQNLSPTTTLTTAVASLPELSGETTHREGTITLSPYKKRSRPTQDNNQSSIDTTSESEPRKAEFLFEKTLTHNDVHNQSKKLVITRSCRDHFLALETTIEGTSNTRQLWVEDAKEKQIMKMTFRIHGDKNVITNGWSKFVKKHNLEANDVVHFYKPNSQPQEGNLFLLKYTKATEIDDRSYRDDNRQEKLLFEKKLTRTETRSSHNNGLVIPQKYWGHFPALDTTNKGGPSDWKQIYCFDDREKRERKMTVRPHGDKLVIRKGWIKFVKDHNLQANDVVRFYKPNQPEEGNSNFILTSTKSNMPNRDDSSIEDKNDRDEDDSTIGGNIEQGDDEDDRTDGDSSEQGDDEDDNADEDCNEEEDDEEDDSSERDDEDDNTDD